MRDRKCFHFEGFSLYEVSQPLIKTSHKYHRTQHQYYSIQMQLKYQNDVNDFPLHVTEICINI